MYGDYDSTRNKKHFPKTCKKHFRDMFNESHYFRIRQIISYHNKQKSILKKRKLLQVMKVWQVVNIKHQVAFEHTFRGHYRMLPQSHLNNLLISFQRLREK